MIRYTIIMNILDIFILLFIALAVYRWYKLGFVQGLFSFVGLVLGIGIGILIAPWVMGQFTAPVVKFIVMLLTIGVTTTLLAGLGEHLGHKLHIKLLETKLTKANAIAGSIFSIFIVLGMIWITAGMLNNSPYKNLNKQIQNSFVIQNLNSRLPATPPIISRLSNLFNPLDFPQVFVGSPPKLSTPVAPAGSVTVQSAVAAAGESTVRIEATGCGDISVGSGFIVNDELVMTNAHVVAGANSVEAVDTSGRHRAEVMYFDPSTDIAILKTNKLHGKSLNISSQTYQRGQEVVVLGFPGGGEFHAEPAGVMRLLEARGLDIYGEHQIDRDVYELRANVVQGNSGGPVVLADGTVIGMIFASAQNESGFGYALTSPELNDALRRVDQDKVSTQRCEAR